MYRASIIPFVLISLLTAVFGGWLRMGWSLPLQSAAGHHGAVMIGSFLTTVIILERVAAYNSRLLFIIPLVNASSAIFFLLNMPLAAQALLIAGSLGLLGIVLSLYLKHKELYQFIFIISAASLLAGNIVLMQTQSYPAAISFWISYLLLLITAERLELTRFLNISKQKINYLILFLGVSFIGVFLPFHWYGNIIMAAGISLTALWLLRFDMALKSVKKTGQHKYSAVLLLVGYVWLFFTGVFMMLGNVNAYWYDAVTHSFFIGFVFSMIFSHAPIILPGVLKLPIKIYRPFLYYWFLLLQLSLLLRLVADVLASPGLRMWGGMFNGLTILGFLISVAVVAIGERGRYLAKLRKSW